jgi:hypothetical protein
MTELQSNASLEITGKGSLLRLELLETNHVRLSFGQPSQQVIQPIIDVVNVEGRDSHQVPLSPCTSGCAPQKEHPSSLFRLALSYRWEEMENPELRRIA